MSRKKAVDIPKSYINPRTTKNFISTGIGGSKSHEPTLEYNKAQNEIVLTNQLGSSIVLGRDRNSHVASGYGGRGETACASMDMVVGRMSSTPVEEYLDEQGKSKIVDPNFKYDAARIYISQRTDIDHYFGIKPGSIGSSIAKSGIAIKADAVRLVGREGIKIVTGIDEVNSQGGLTEVVRGIDLIAGNDDGNLEPLVKGRALVKALDTLTAQVEDLSACLNTLIKTQSLLEKVISNHTHQGVVLPTPSPLPIVQTTPSVELKVACSTAAAARTITLNPSMFNVRLNLKAFRMRFLERSGAGYINSYYNNTN
tara:strand:- start:812 stop:1747 length:936 start_codon:yes stop_codon:yes gene_type:complete